MDKSVNELQRLYDNALESIKANNCFIKDGKVVKNETVSVINVTGTFYDEYMGDEDWKYRKVNGDIIITDEQRDSLIKNIIDCDNVETEEDENNVLKAMNMLKEILVSKDWSFQRLGCIENGEFNGVYKEKDSVQFSDEAEHDWSFEFVIHKINLKDLKEFEISPYLYGWI